MWLFTVGVAFGQAVIVGEDWAGADLVPGSDDLLEGVFTNVDEFRVGVGVTALVQRGVALEVYANRIVIDGVLNGSGAGFAGGNGAPAGAFDGNNGQGPGRGGGGIQGPCVHGGGGGGGGFGGYGGLGAYYFNTGQGQRGVPYGDPMDSTVLEPGSGGGGGGSGCDLPAGNGGRGGGAILLVAGTIEIAGEVRADGSRGPNGQQWSGGGGGGSGGMVVVDGGVVDGTGSVFARGGDGGNTIQNIGGLAGGGGGGGGGRIYILHGSATFALSLDVSGGQRGLDQSANFANPGTNGQPGTTHSELTDPDPDDDGVDAADDNCPSTPNPNQLDSDGDGLGDACDPCPDDPNDADGDGVCDSIDLCPGGNDNFDADEDGQPDACDCAPDDALAQTDGVELCDEVDNNCNGLVDEPGSEGERAFYADLDGDGFGDPDNERTGCTAPMNYLRDDTDCNDGRPDAFPGGEEVCDGIDNDCDGSTDPGCTEPVDEGVGCGCDSAGSPATWLILAVVAASRRRRLR